MLRFPDGLVLFPACGGFLGRIHETVLGKGRRRANGYQNQRDGRSKSYVVYHLSFPTVF
jgi:hypothetical protein